MGGSVPGAEQNQLEIAQKRFGVDLNDDNAVLDTMGKLKGKMPDIMDLSNLWQDYQLIKPLSPAKVEATRDQNEFNELTFIAKAEKELMHVIVERWVALNDQLKEKKMNLIPYEAASKAIDELVKMAVEARRSAPDPEQFDMEKWIKNVDQKRIEKTFQQDLRQAA